PRRVGRTERLSQALQRRKIAAPHGGPASMRGALVAVIDDDPAAVDAMTALFETWGANVAGGGDAESLLEALGAVERYPDLVVADLRLACGESGIAVVHKLRDELGIAVPAPLVSGDIGPRAARGESGRAVVHKLRDELGIALPALLVSGDIGPGAERDARMAGLMLLPKPVVPAVLQAIATALIARA